LKIGIISDTHGSVAAWEEAMSKAFHDVDLIVHSGDVLYHGPRNPFPRGYEPQKLAALINESPVPVLIARGNCDADIDQVLINWPLQAPYCFLQIENLRLLVTHGDRLSFEEMNAQARRHQVDVLVFGHTHVPEIKRENGVIMLNPGSPALPKGSPAVPTVALLDRSTISLLDLQACKVIDKVCLGP
jgi:putative phosphoesterase